MMKIYAFRNEDGQYVFTTNYQKGGVAFNDWEAVWKRFSVISLLKGKFSIKVTDMMDPRFYDLYEEIRDYHGGQKVFDEAVSYQRNEFNWFIESALKQDPYGSGVPKNLPPCISKMSVDYNQQMLIWETEDGMTGEVSLTSRQTRRLTQDGNSVVWQRVEKKWEAVA